MPNRSKRSLPERSKSSPSETSQLRAIGDAPVDWSAVNWAASFIDRFEKSAEPFATTRGLEKQPDGSITFPWNEYSPAVREFVEGLYERNLMVLFDWGKWKRGETLFNKPSQIASATAEDCLKLITLCVRQDRFNDGFLAQALESGVIVACLKRLRELHCSS
jgi:hypothetical protein